jgi:hypothetical protein
VLVEAREGVVMGPKADPFEASASAVGYVYQLYKALLTCVELYGLGLGWSVAIEAGDDIESQFDQETRLWQLKHRAPGTRMTDASSDLWKTLRIWARVAATRRLELDETELLLFTTAELPAGTVGCLLQPEQSGERDEVQALALIFHVAEACA